MELEAGDFFAVTKGIALNNSFFKDIFGSNTVEGDEWKSSAVVEDSKEPKHDRSHEGFIYQALEICGPLVAAKVVVAKLNNGYRAVNDVFPLNVGEVEVMTLTPNFVKLLTEGK